MTARARGALALLAAALLVGACSNHSGLRKLKPTDAPSSAVLSPPDGLAGSTPPPTSPKPKPSRSRASATPTSSTSAGSPSSSAAASTARRVQHHPAGGGSSTRARSTSPRHTTSPPPPPRGPGLAAAPNSGLNGGQRVQVTGTGFGAGQAITLRECRTGSGSCPLYLARVTADSGGSLRQWVWVSSVLGLDSCGTDGCLIAGLRADGSTAATVRISFG